MNELFHALRVLKKREDDVILHSIFKQSSRNEMWPDRTGVAASVVCSLLRCQRQIVMMSTMVRILAREIKAAFDHHIMSIII